MDADHRFVASVVWTGDRGTGTSGSRAFGREHVVSSPGKPDIAGSAARAFHGDLERWNPEELLVAALAQCHMLSLFYVATRRGVVITSYADDAVGTLVTSPDASGRFTEVVLRPRVGYASPPPDEAGLHEEAHRVCFIANSVNFPVRVEPERVEPVRGEPVEP
jgi:organic hydroperoxide reductase OsmC/OhrA